MEVRYMKIMKRASSNTPHTFVDAVRLACSFMLYGLLSAVSWLPTFVDFVDT
jgi:hypothetical protein